MATSEAIRFRYGVQLSPYSPSLTCAFPLLRGCSPPWLFVFFLYIRPSDLAPPLSGSHKGRA
jgi:hypothetical protein